MIDRGQMLRLGATALAVTLVAMPCAVAQDGFFQGKTVTLIIGFPPGGGYDAYGRLIAKSLGEHLPGKPVVQIQHMPGASGLRAANHLYNVAAKDGTSIALFSSSTAFAPLFGSTSAQYKTEEFGWIGNLEQGTATCVSWHTSPIKHFDDLLKRPAIFGGAGATAVNSEHPRAFNNLFNTRIKVIHGYPGGQEIFLAMQRGEVEGACGFAFSSLMSVRRADLEAGRLIPIMQMGPRKPPELGNAAHIYDYAKTEDERKLFNILFGRHIMGRPIAAPPGLPPQRLATLRKAFDAAVAEPSFIEQAKKDQLDVEPMSGEEVQRIVAEFQSYPRAIIDRAIKAIEVSAEEAAAAAKAKK